MRTGRTTSIGKLGVHKHTANFSIIVFLGHNSKRKKMQFNRRRKAMRKTVTEPRRFIYFLKSS